MALVQVSWSIFLDFMKQTYYLQAEGDIKDGIDLETSTEKAKTIWHLTPEQEMVFPILYKSLYERLSILLAETT